MHSQKNIHYQGDFLLYLFNIRDYSTSSKYGGRMSKKHTRRSEIKRRRHTREQRKKELKRIGIAKAKK